jgi:cell fate regulator YaaT (PSP1 superfamily)
MIRLVFVKQANGRAEEFDAGDLTLELGENVVVDAEKGQVLGKVLSAPQEKEKRFLLKSPRKVIRKATPEDLDQLHRNEQLEKDAFASFTSPQKRGSISESWSETWLQNSGCGSRCDRLA